jgi:hypothetical protein
MTLQRLWLLVGLVLVLDLFAGRGPGGQPPLVLPPAEPLHGTVAEVGGQSQPLPPPSPYSGPAVVDPSWFAPPPGAAGPDGCRHGRCAALLHRFGVGCWSDHTLPICGNGHTHLVFIFGSCKSFFGEPCLAKRKPPLVPVPPGYEPFPYGQP